MNKTIFIVLMEVFILYWWLCLAYSRKKTAETGKVDETKYAAWDEAYNKALKADKGQYYAVCMAAKAVQAGPQALKAWDDAYNQAVGAGIRKYSAGNKAAAAARRAAHKHIN